MDSEGKKQGKRSVWVGGEKGLSLQGNWGREHD